MVVAGVLGVAYCLQSANRLRRGERPLPAALWDWLRAWFERERVTGVRSRDAAESRTVA